ncbi:MAG TPA: hypothetical protein PLH24_06130, partial [Candidatus Atribacteria bacterium]|nr:hypothetical protein [Candidatus Atribacteria bacterium]
MSILSFFSPVDPYSTY